MVDDKSGPPSLTGSADQLESVLREIDAGGVEATKTQRAYLAGAIEALRQAQIALESSE